jgi:Protein of unknown function (DUF2917)
MKSVESEMDGYLVHGGMDLARGSNVRIEDGAGILVYVWEGELWVTQENDQRDHFVTPGRWFRLERNGASLLHATHRSHVTLTAPTPANYARFIAMTPAGTGTPHMIYEASREHRSWLDRLRYRFRFLDKRPSFQ